MDRQDKVGVTFLIFALVVGLFFSLIVSDTIIIGRLCRTWEDDRGIYTSCGYGIMFNKKTTTEELQQRIGRVKNGM